MIADSNLESIIKMKNTMKLRFILMAIVTLVVFNTGVAQQDEECMNNLSIFDQELIDEKMINLDGTNNKSKLDLILEASERR